MTDRPQNGFRIGDWLVEPDLNRLSTEHETAQVEPKAMAVLVYLCRRPGRVVSTDEIIADVWAGRPMGDNPVYKTIAKLRRTLGDDPGNPRFIATVPKKGYRLVCAVSEGGAHAAATEKPTQPPRRLPLIAVGLVAGVAIAGLLFWRPQVGPASVRLVSSFPGSHSQPSYSLEGEHLTFVSDAGGVPHIWVLDRGSLNPRQLTHGEDADARPRWSPDGHTILFARRNSIWSVPEAGGDAIEVVRDAYNPNWSGDGRRIVFERRYQVWIADADGGQQERVVGIPQPELPLSPRWPALSPDGTRIVYFDSDNTPLGDLWLIDAGGGDPDRLTFSPALGGAPVWTPDGEHIIYSSQRGGSRTLWRVNLRTKNAEALLVGSGDDDFPDLDPDGTRVIYTNSRQRFALVLSDPDTGKHQDLFESRQTLVAPELSPGGDSLVFFGAARAGSFQIFTLPLTGGTPRMITSDPTAAHALPQWSGDGSAFYYFHVATETSFNRVDVAGGEPVSVVDGWNWNVANGARVDPGQERIIYSRLTGQTPVQTRVRNLTTEQDRSFHATLEYPRWSADGLNVTGSRLIDQRFPGDVAICPIAGSECRILAEGARIPVWSADETLVYFVRGFGPSQDLFVAPVDGSGEERQIMTMAPLFPLGPFYAVTRDGMILWVRYEEGRKELWVAELPGT